MKATRILLFLLCIIGLKWLLLQAPSTSILGAFNNLYAQKAPIQSNKRPAATKSSNTWICFVTASVVGVIVFFIGKLDQQKQEAEESRQENMRLEKEKKLKNDTTADSKVEGEKDHEADKKEEDSDA